MFLSEKFLVIVILSKLQDSCDLSAFSEDRKSRKVMKVPKGTSDYQATWIKYNAEEDVDDDDDDDVDSCDDDVDEMMEDEMDDNESQVNCASFYLAVYHKQGSEAFP